MGIVSVSRASPCAVGPWILGFFLALGSVFWEEEITSLAAWLLLLTWEVIHGIVS